jgi:hypothetical protein
VKRIDLNKQSEAIKQFIKAQIADPEGTVIELNGEAVARIVSMQPAHPGKSGSLWSSDQEDRREFLIERELENSLTPEEAEELRLLHRQLHAYTNRDGEPST